MNTLQRIKEYIDYKGITNQRFEKEVGFSNGAFASQLKRNKTIGVDKLENILNVYSELNPSWLLTGKGKMLLTEEKKPASEIILATPDTTNQISIPVVNIKAAANYVTGYQTQEFIEELEAILLPKSMVGDQQHYAFQTIGDSMHPTIYNDDYILARLLDTSEWKHTKENYIHVIVSNTRGVVIKRIKNRIESNGFIRCKSDNRHHPAFNINYDDILQIFEVKCKLSFNLPDEGYNVYNQLSKLEDKIEELEQTQNLLATHISKTALNRLKKRQKESEENEKTTKKEKVK